MGNKLFVGGLAWATGDEGLADAFSRFTVPFVEDEREQAGGGEDRVGLKQQDRGARQR